MSNASEVRPKEIGRAVETELYGLDGFEIPEDLIPGKLESLCLQGLLEGDLQIEGKEVTEDVACDPTFVSMKDRANLEDTFQIRKGSLHLPEVFVRGRHLVGGKAAIGEKDKHPIEPGFRGDLVWVDPRPLSIHFEKPSVAPVSHKGLVARGSHFNYYFFTVDS